MAKLALRVLNIDPGDALLYETFQAEGAAAVKLRALDRLGITSREGEPPLQAWIRAMCAENDLPYTQPAPRQLADAILDSRAAARFVFFLAGSAK